jgi:iron(III) transport system substrate-binding protein
LAGCSPATTPTKSVVVYVSEDQVFSEPVLKAFEKATGIVVKAAYDTEEAKSTGAMNRLVAEASNPQADVYWANEPVRAEILRQRGISAPYQSPAAAGIPDGLKDPAGHWTGFSARARVFVVHKTAKDKPRSVRAYVDPRWKGRAVIANPLFGTTTDQMAALFVLWGDDASRQFLEGMKANAVRVSTSNGESADLVASGEMDFALVDSDDAFSRVKDGKPIEMVIPDQGAGEAGVLIVPNAVVLIKNGPHPAEARQLVDFLLSKESERMLAFADCAQIPLHTGVDTPAQVPRIETLKVMKADFAHVASKAQQIQPLLKAWAGY